MVEFKFDRKNRVYQPGSTMRLRVEWKSLKADDDFDLSMGWRTEGKGTTDTEESDSTTVTVDATSGVYEWEVQLPLGPWSVEGQLVSIHWYVRAESIVSDWEDEESFTMSRLNKPISLPKLEPLSTVARSQ